MSKLSTALRVMREGGVKSVCSVIQDRYFRSLTDLAHKLAVSRKRTVEIDGCTFSLDNQLIDLESKLYLCSGDYEGGEREALALFLDPTFPVVEFGAAVGVVSCLTNKRLRDPSRHVVVEANPLLIPLLEVNRNANNCGFEVVNAVVGYGASHAEFTVYLHQYLGSNALDQRSAPVAEMAERERDVRRVQTIELETVTLGSLLDKHNFPRCTFICDIEGTEEKLMENEAMVLRDRADLIIMETHPFWIGSERAQWITDELKNLDFEQVFVRGDTYVFKKVAARCS